MNRCEELSLGSLAPSSRRAYTSAWKKFKDLAGSLGASPLPCSSADLKKVISNFADSSRKFHAVKQMMAAVSFFHRLEGFSPPCSSPDVKLLVKGIKRMCFSAPKRAKPLTSDIVKSVIESLLGEDLRCSSYYDVSLRNWRTAACIVLSFSALCRFDDMKKITTDNISFEDNRALVFIPSSKTDQFGEGQLVSIVASGNPSCPVFFLKAYFARLLWESALEGKVYSGPFLPSLHRRRVTGPLGSCWSSLPPSSPSPIAYNCALLDFRKALVGVVADPEAYGLHSGRRGGATEAIRNGCDFLTLKRQGRWRSDNCPQLYVDDVLNRSSRFTSFLSI